MPAWGQKGLVGNLGWHGAPLLLRVAGNCRLACNLRALLSAELLGACLATLKTAPSTQTDGSGVLLSDFGARLLSLSLGGKLDNPLSKLVRIARSS